MDKHQAYERIEKLKKLINHHRYLYHVLDTQEISDAALDSLKKELFNLEQQYPEFITKDSPTQRVGGQVQKEFKKVKHIKRMLSLNDAFSKEDVEDWVGRFSKLLTDEEKSKIDFYVELKIDGLAIELVYENGLLKTGSTRGDGTFGEDITQNLKTIDAIPLSLQTNNYKLPTRLVVRGEVFISKKEFKAVNDVRKKEGLELYANPRNIAAGSVRQLDPKITASRKLDSFMYDIVDGIASDTHAKKHQWLKELGFKTNSHNQYAKSIEDIFSFYEKCKKIREKLNYEIDGLVVTVNNNDIFEKLGVVGKTPRASIAFKFAQSQATTVVNDIKIQVGRTGAMTPVAILEPVQISGITISRATLHNEDEIKRLGVKIGDTVIVGRAGDVIPDIIKVLPELRSGKEKSFIMPTVCPSCHSKLEKSDTESLWRCPNSKCFARKRRNFYHFVSRAAFNIDGLGPKIIDRLLDEGLVSDASNLFALKAGDVAQLERFGAKSAENLVESIAQKKQISLARFIYALGIRNVGEETASDLAKTFGSLKHFIEADLHKLESILNIGPVVAKSIFEWISNKENKIFLQKLLNAGVKIQKHDTESGSSMLKGKTFIFTGTLESIERNLAKEKVRSLGGQVTESISSNVDFLVVGKNPGSKLAKAKELGLTILGEKEFLSMIK